jgi:hypothetical protein
MTQPFASCKESAMPQQRLSPPRLKGLLYTLLLVFTYTMAASTAQAAKHDSNKTTTSKHQSNRLKIQNTRSSSDETSAERDKRLSRECQGRPNSGMCAGYAYKQR